MSGHRNFGIMSRPEVLSGSSNSRPATRDNYASRDLKSFYRLPPQSILHGEEIADSPLHVGALCFVVAFGSAIAVLFGVGLCVLRFVGL